MDSKAGNYINHANLQRLIISGTIRNTQVLGHPGGWSIVIEDGISERALVTQRTTIRSFRNFDTVVRYLKELGISKFQVNSAEFDPQSLKTTRRTRPDSADRMRRVHQSFVWLESLPPEEPPPPVH